jgi:glycosyltransferase involved in cell wall biosynthesis
MTHPWDIGIEKFLKSNAIKCFRVIHDATKHPGDIWPSNTTIRKSVQNADTVITLSMYVKSKIISYNPNIVLCDFPKITQIPRNPKVEKTSSFVIGIIGRSATYKGLEVGLQACQEFRSEQIKVSVVGQVARSIRPRDFHLVDRIVDHWLTPEEFNREIEKLDLVLLPYTEASQSGIIPIAISFNKKIVVPNVGGLPEQLEFYANGIISESSSVNHLALALDKAIKLELQTKNIGVTIRTPLDEYLASNL